MTHLITTTPKPILVVGVNKEWIEDGCELRGSYDPKKNAVLSFYGCHPAMGLPSGKWSIAFLWSERTEQKSAELLPFKTALDALESLFKSEKLFTENPFGKEPPFIFCSQIDSEEVIKMRQDKSDEEWRLAQLLVHEDYIILVEEGVEC